MQNASAKTLRVASYIFGICLSKSECIESNATLQKEFGISSDGVADLLKILKDNNCIEVAYSRSNVRKITLKKQTKSALEKEFSQLQTLFETSKKDEGIRFQAERYPLPSGEVSASKRRGYPLPSGEGIRFQADTPTLTPMIDSDLRAAKLSKIFKNKISFSVKNVGFPHTPFLRVSNILNNNINNKLSTAHTHTREEKIIITPFVTIQNQLRKTADEIFVRGIAHKHVVVFCEKFNGYDFDSNETLAKSLKEFVKTEVNVAKSKSAAETLEERKERFRLQVDRHQSDNRNAYPDQHYKEFFEYWTEPIVNETKSEISDKSKMRFEIQKTFVIASRLAWSFKNIYQKRYPHGSDKSKFIPNQNRAQQFASSTSKQPAFVDLEAVVAARTGTRNESEGCVTETTFYSVE